jgi:hypothetical protein
MTKWLRMQSWILALRPLRMARNGPFEKDFKTFLARQKQVGLVTSRAAETPFRMVRLGVMIRTRPEAMPKGSVAMIPVLPAPTGMWRMAGAALPEK